MAIDIGPGATDRAQTITFGFTIIQLGNPANGPGVLDSVEVWANSNLTGLKIGTFFLVAGTTYQCRDSSAIGNVTSGSKQTFGGLSIDVETGDFLGAYWASGDMERDSALQAGQLYDAGDNVNPGSSEVYALQPGDACSFYATGGAAPGGGDEGLMFGSDF